MTEEEEIDEKEFFDTSYEALNKEIEDIKNRIKKMHKIKDEDTFYEAKGRLEEISNILENMKFRIVLLDVALNYPIEKFFNGEEGPELVMGTDPKPSQKRKFPKESSNMYR